MAKQAVFLIVSNGVDGLDPTRINEAYLTEEERDDSLNANSNKAYLRKEDRVVDLEQARANAFKKLDGLDMLALFPPDDY